MKTCVSSVIFLLLGLAVGFYAGNRSYHKYIVDEAVQGLVESSEASEAFMAAMSARTISLIDSGQSQQAVQMLSFPIAHYYYLYATSEFTNAQRLQVRALIESVACSNQIVATQIAKEMSDKKK